MCVYLIVKTHSPDIGRPICTSTLRNEVDVAAILAPYGTEVIGCMISELRELRTVHAASINIGILVKSAIAHGNPATADKHYPLAIG